MPESAPVDGRAVFLSYAHEDAAAARRIAEALRSSGVEVWLDESQLRGGDAWDAKIRKQIKDCALFVAIVSAHTQARGEGYFRREWRLGVERTHDMADSVAFIVPVVIDATKESEALVPGEFLRVQWERLPGALPTPQFILQVKRLLGVEQKVEVGGRKPEVGPAARKSRKPTWTWGAVVAVVAGVGTALYMANKPEVASAPAPKTEIPEPKTAAAPPARAADKSIAVIPFENRSTDKEANAVFTDGIHEDILTNLSRIRDLRVVSRTSVEQYRGTKKLIGQIARELGVTYILEGSVQRDGNKVRVTGQLIRAATDEHIWADNYTRDLTDLFTIQSELAKAIAGELQAALSPREKAVLERKPTENLAAYELWLKARDLNYREPSFQAASAQMRESLLQSAVELDPKFASAWAALAAVHARFHFNGLDRTPARLAKAKAAIDRAVSLEPDSPEVIHLLGTYYYLSQRDYPRATEQMEKILRLQPNDVEAWNYLGVIQRSQGRWPEAIASTRKAVQLDPASVGAARNLLSTLRYVRRFEEAMVVARRLLVIDPNPMAQIGVFRQTEASWRGTTPETDEFFRQLAAREPNRVRSVAGQKITALTHGDYAEFIRLDGLERYSDDDGTIRRIQALIAAEVYLAIGDNVAAHARLDDFPAQLRARLVSEPTNGGIWQALSRMEFILGNRDEALRCAIKATEFPEAQDAFEGPRAWTNLAVIHAWLGDQERAIDELAEILRKPSYLNVNLLKTDPVYFPLRGHPKFEALLNDPRNNAPLY